MAAIAWTDAVLGAVVLRSSYPTLGSRPQSWTLLINDAGELVESPFTAARFLFAWRDTDHGVACAFLGISAHPAAGLTTPAGLSPLVLATRLARHLNVGGTIELRTENAAATTYACTIWPGATIAPPELEDPAAMDYTLRLSLRNVAGAPMPYPYSPAA